MGEHKRSKCYEYFNELNPGLIECLLTDPEVEDNVDISSLLHLVEAEGTIGVNFVVDDMYHNIVKVKDPYLYQVVNRKEPMIPKLWMTIRSLFKEYKRTHKIIRITEFTQIASKSLNKNIPVSLVSMIMRRTVTVKKRKKRLKDIEEDVLRLWRQGYSIPQIARNIKIGIGTVYRVLEKHGYRKKRKKKKETMVTDSIVQGFCAVLKATKKQWLAGLVVGIGLGTTTRIKKYCKEMTPPNYREVAAREMALAGIRSDIIKKYTGVEELPPPSPERVQRTLEALRGYKGVVKAEKFLSPTVLKLVEVRK